jgi:hypothetical protein
MKLEIKSFADPGNFEKERVVLRASADEDIGSYVLMRSQAADDGSPTSGRKSAYWLPDKRLKGGDMVVVYTKKGSSSKKQLASGATVHFYYWNLTDQIWGEDKNNVAVLFDARNWISATPQR